MTYTGLAKLHSSSIRAPFGLRAGETEKKFLPGAILREEGFTRSARDGLAAIELAEGVRPALDSCRRGLKPGVFWGLCGTIEVVP
jgi:hypothetical protein